MDEIRPYPRVDSKLGLALLQMNYGPILGLSIIVAWFAKNGLVWANRWIEVDLCMDARPRKWTYVA